MEAAALRRHFLQATRRVGVEYFPAKQVPEVTLEFSRNARNKEGGSLAALSS